MRRSLTGLLLCLQLVSTTMAQRPQTWPPPIPEPPPRPRQQPQTQKQTPQPKSDDDLDVVKITTNLVQVDAIVTDDKGKPVTDLRADEIEISEDGKARTISNFSYVDLGSKAVESRQDSRPVTNTNIPIPPVPLRPGQTRRAMALVVDDLGLSFDSAYYVRQGLKKFVDEQMGPDDLVAIIRTGSGIGALQQFTTDKRMLYAAIERVKWNPRSRASNTALSLIPGEGRVEGPASEMQDAARVSLQEFREEVYTTGTLGALSYVIRGMKTLPGRKSVVLFSDGFGINDSDSSRRAHLLAMLRRLSDLANRSSVVFYTVHAIGLPTLNVNAADAVEGMGAQDVEVMLREKRKAFFASQDGLDYLSSRTGGLSFKNSNNLNESVRKVMLDQGGYYLIGYRPEDSTFQQVNGVAKYHEVSLKVKRPGKYVVRMRNGFYGVSDEQIKSLAQTSNQQIVSALLSPFTTSEIQVRLTSLFVNDAKVGSAMRSFLHVNAKDLDFVEEADGMHKAELEIMALAFGDNGQLVDQFSYVQTIRIKKENFERGMKNGLTYNALIPIKSSGAYQFRIALRDRSSGRIGSASQLIEVPDIKKDRLLISGIVIKGMPLAEYLGTTAQNDGGENIEVMKGESLPNASPAVRQFRTGMALAYGYNIYNAQLDKRTGKPNLKVQVRVFRNGTELFTGDPLAFDSNGQTDLKRLTANGGIQLGANMTPGEYVLQVIVTDSATEKVRVASQWLDFEIVK